MKTSTANRIKNYIGIDVGGTTVKGAAINALGEILCEDAVETPKSGDGEQLYKNVVGLVNDLIIKCDGSKADFVGVGVGCPGLIDSTNGEIVFAGNLGLSNYPLAKTLSQNLSMPVKITNDANAAALGEAKFGAGKKYSDSILVTLGTGVGGGIVVGGKLFEGGNSAGTEIGHMVIVKDGEPCTCGRRGCLEAYASATALIRQTKAAMLSNSGSAMWKTYTPETVTGKTAFEYAGSDVVAKAVVDDYISNLACGLINLANVFRPQVIMLGGGVANQKERLTKPLQDILDKELFAGSAYAPVKVICASLGNKAGVYGAAALFS